MTRLIWHMTMSLDGYMADEHDTLDWVPMNAGGVPIGKALIPRIGAILTGRGTFDAGIDTPETQPYGQDFRGRIVVVTNRDAPGAPSGELIETGGLVAALERAKSLADGQDVVILGARLGQSYLAKGLVDEVLVHIAPVLLGGGRKTFSEDGKLRNFTVLERSAPEDMTTLRLAPVER